jgi:hypothetical protein
LPLCHQFHELPVDCIQTAAKLFEIHCFLTDFDEIPMCVFVVLQQFCKPQQHSITAAQRFQCCYTADRYPVRRLTGFRVRWFRANIGREF